jgi:hypothetical protein
MVIGTLCLLGAVGALRFLPGRVPPEPQSEEPAPTVAVVPA